MPLDCLLPIQSQIEVLARIVLGEKVEPGSVAEETHNQHCPRGSVNQATSSLSLRAVTRRSKWRRTVETSSSAPRRRAFLDMGA